LNKVEIRDNTNSFWVTYLYEYDALGRVRAVGYSPGGLSSGLILITEYDYDKAGNLIAVAYPGGRAVEINRTQARFTSLDMTPSGGSIQTGVIQTDHSEGGYQHFGGLKLFKTANNLLVDYVYDTDGRLEKAKWDYGSIIFDYEYDAFGNIHNIFNRYEPDAIQTFLYDIQQRLVEAVGSYGKYEYSYDDVGNRTSRKFSSGDPLTQQYEELYRYAGQSYSHPGAITGTKSRNQLKQVIEMDPTLSTKNRERNFTFDAAGIITKDERIEDPEGIREITTLNHAIGNSNRVDLIY
jgi:hypothetical protein